jgi:hypothetical protein
MHTSLPLWDLLYSRPMKSLDPITQIQLISGGFYLARSLQVVAELGVADLIFDAPMSSAELGHSTGSDPEALGRVLNLLCAHGIFATENGLFRHSECSTFLRTDHPMSMRPFARMFGIPVLWEAAIRLDKSVANGRPMGDVVTEGGFWSYLKEHPDDSEQFNETMVAKANAVNQLVAKSYDFSQFARIADVGGGRGHLLRTILKTAPSSRGILFDQPHVIDEIVQEASNSVELRAGNFFENRLPEADGYVLMEVVHDWDDQHAEKILNAVRDAAPLGAKLLLVEAMMPDVPTPCWTVTLDVIMLNLLGGKQRSLAEYARLINRCRFADVKEIPVGAGYSILEAVVC